MNDDVVKLLTQRIDEMDNQIGALQDARLRVAEALKVLAPEARPRIASPNRPFGEVVAPTKPRQPKKVQKRWKSGSVYAILQTIVGAWTNNKLKKQCQIGNLRSSIKKEHGSCPSDSTIWRAVRLGEKQKQIRVVRLNGTGVGSKYAFEAALVDTPQKSQDPRLFRPTMRIRILEVLEKCRTPLTAKEVTNRLHETEPSVNHDSVHGQLSSLRVGKFVEVEMVSVNGHNIIGNKLTQLGISRLAESRKQDEQTLPANGPLVGAEQLT